MHRNDLNRHEIWGWYGVNEYKVTRVSWDELAPVFSLLLGSFFCFFFFCYNCYTVRFHSGLKSKIKCKANRTAKIILLSNISVRQY